MLPFTVMTCIRQAKEASFKVPDLKLSLPSEHGHIELLPTPLCIYLSLPHSPSHLRPVYLPAFSIFPASLSTLLVRGILTGSSLENFHPSSLHCVNEYKAQPNVEIAEKKKTMSCLLHLVLSRCRFFSLPAIITIFLSLFFTALIALLSMSSGTEVGTLSQGRKYSHAARNNRHIGLLFAANPLCIAVVNIDPGSSRYRDGPFLGG